MQRREKNELRQIEKGGERAVRQNYIGALLIHVWWNLNRTFACKLARESEISNITTGKELTYHFTNIIKTLERCLRNTHDYSLH